MLKRIGKEARLALEDFLGGPVYVELWVKVRKNWRHNERDCGNLATLGGKTDPALLVKTFFLCYNPRAI
jgi:hypothetical protein